MCISCGLVVLVLQVQAGVLLLVAGVVNASILRLPAQHCKQTIGRSAAACSSSNLKATGCHSSRRGRQAGFWLAMLMLQVLVGW
jgi:hypothetical protein